MSCRRWWTQTLEWPWHAWGVAREQWKELQMSDCDLVPAPAGFQLKLLQPISVPKGQYEHLGI